MKLLLVILMGSLGLLAQDLFPQDPMLLYESESSSFFSLVSPDPAPSASLSIIGKDGKPAITITYDGKVTFGEGITPNEAAKQFTEALEKYIGMKMCTERLVIEASGNVGLGNTIKRMGAKK